MVVPMQFVPSAHGASVVGPIAVPIDGAAVALFIDTDTIPASIRLTLEASWVGPITVPKP